jgi:2-polyprenyl-3-methyl-5-hydroxy-6-metoxy-1,4-benzoquinol methylase
MRPFTVVGVNEPQLPNRTLRLIGSAAIWAQDAVDEQQIQTLSYFREFATQWRQKALGALPDKVNIIEQRNAFARMVAEDLDSPARALDVGCGSGELVCDLARGGLRTIGIDFSPEMIALCEQKARTEGVEGAEFVAASIFDTRLEARAYDLIVANGFIEYISPEDMLRFFRDMHRALKPQGAFVVGSRNRLFNAFSLNAFTEMEQRMGAFDALVAESIGLCGSESMRECIDSLSARSDALPFAERHPATEVKVETRHQYTPSQLVKELGGIGFDVVELYPVHYHGIPPGFGRTHPAVHVAMAELAQGFARGEHRLLPFASTFMVHASRGED